MSLLTERTVYRPFEYPMAEDYAMKQQQAHWLHTEVSMASDVQDWERNLTEAERTLVGNILKGFTQIELNVGDYWGRRVPQWFPKPEVTLMANTFAGFEAIHAMAYAHLNTTLGLEDFDAFLYEPAARDKIDAVVDVGFTPSPSQAALSLGVYSGFVEGVSLFSQFAMLMSFAQRNLMKGVAQITSWSVRDESLHADAGCWLYRTLVREHPDLHQPSALVHYAKLIVALEEDYIDMCFAGGEIDGITPHDTKHFIKHRANTRLGDLGLKPEFDVDEKAVKRMRWFDVAAAGVEHQDFFAMRPTSYSKGHVDWDDAF